MKKKSYNSPQIIVASCQVKQMFCITSGVKSDNGIGYGGRDDEGTITPAIRHYEDIWEE